MEFQWIVGDFPTLDHLKRDHPHPEEGDWAFVGIGLAYVFKDGWHLQDAILLDRLADAAFEKADSVGWSGSREIDDTLPASDILEESGEDMEAEVLRAFHRRETERRRNR